EVFCTIQLQALNREWAYPAGILEVLLHYHTKPGGNRGQLYLRSPSSSGGDYLARLLKTDVEVEGAIVAPRGLQRGSNDEHEIQEGVPVYPSLTSLFNEFFLPLIAVPVLWIWPRGPILPPSLPEERVALNQAIQRANALPDILNHLNALSDMLDRRDRAF